MVGREYGVGMTAADVIVLGVGPGGEQVVGDLLNAGLSVIAIEAGLVGGECPYWGCIPSKTAIRAATTIEEARRLNALAGTATVHPDWAPVARRIRDEMTDNWDDKVAADRITDKGGNLIRGRGVVTGPRSVEVDGTIYVARRALVIATGTVSAIPPVERIDQVKYWTNRDAMETTYVPDSMIVLGGGAIGCELAQVFARFGSSVTLVEFAPRLLAAEEPEVSEIVEKSLKADGIDVRVGVGAKKAYDGTPVELQLSDGSFATGDVVLLATGRKVDLVSIGADSIGAGPANGHDRALPTDDYLRVLGPDGQPIEGVYGVGDVVGKGAFTHVATTQGRMVVDQILGKETRPFNERSVGHVTFTDPEVGGVGLTEQAARDQGIDVATATYPMQHVSRAFIHGPGNEGLLKVVVDRASRTVVGATVVGPHAGEVLSGLTVAVAGKVSLDDLITTVWAFPTYHRGYDAVFGELPQDLRPIR